MLKNSLSIVATLAVATVILFSSCKKNDDVSSATPMTTGENQAIASTSSLNPIPDSYTFTSHDGHIIGVNGARPDVGGPSHKGMIINSCGAASNLTIQAISATGADALYHGWNPGQGALIQVFINGEPYHDPTSGYTLWSGSVNGLTCAASGIITGNVFNDFIRTYCNQDTTGSSYYDSPVTTYTVPAGFPTLNNNPVTQSGHGHRH